MVRRPSGPVEVRVPTMTTEPTTHLDSVTLKVTTAAATTNTKTNTNTAAAAAAATQRTRWDNPQRDAPEQQESPLARTTQPGNSADISALAAPVDDAKPLPR